MIAQKDDANILDASLHERRKASRLTDETFRKEYDRAQVEIRQIDDVMRALDRLREGIGLSKADLARRIGKNPASVRRLFTAKSNPELRTVAAIATALGARIEIVPPKKSNRTQAKQGPISA